MPGIVLNFTYIISLKSLHQFCELGLSPFYNEELSFKEIDRSRIHINQIPHKGHYFCTELNLIPTTPISYIQTSHLRKGVVRRTNQDIFV